MFETVVIDGIDLPIKSVSISISAEASARTAQASFAVTGTTMPVKKGQPIKISASGTLLLTGYVRDINPSYDAGGQRQLSVSFVSKTVDASETSVVHKTGEVLNKSLPDIAREFDNLGIGIEDDGSFPVEPVHRLIPGESNFDTVYRRIRGRGGLISDTAEGKLKLSTKPAGRHAGSLQRGRNITSASANFTESGQYSDVMVRGQASIGSDAPQLRGQATAKDKGVSRSRPIILAHEGEVLVDRMKTKAEFQAKRGAGEASTASISTIGWRDDGGQIWTPNFLVRVEDDWIYVKGDMVIKSVTLNQDAEGQGTTASISLADPRALGGDNPRGNTDAAYSASTTPATFEAQ